jgi:hypothetical protein
VGSSSCRLRTSRILMNRATYKIFCISSLCASVLSTFVNCSITSSSRLLTVYINEGRLIVCHRNMHFMTFVGSPIPQHGWEWKWRPFGLDLTSHIINYPGEQCTSYPLAIMLLLLCTICGVYLYISYDTPIHNKCTKCKYDLKGLPDQSPCPECGGLKPNRDKL